MKKQQVIKALKIGIPIFFGVFLIWITYKNTTSQEREDVLHYIKNANYFWVILSIFLGLLSHLSRAYRWGFALEAIGYKPKFLNRFMAVMIAYFANLGIPRSGEVLIATTLSTYENVPFEKAFGTIVAERIADVIMSLFFILIALILKFDLISKIFIDIFIFIKNKTTGNFMVLIFFSILLLLLLYSIYRVFRNSKNKLFQKTTSFALGLKEGILSIFTMQKKWAFIGHTVFIWSLYLFMFYVVFFAIPETTNISFSAAIVSFVTGSFVIATTNGGLGSFPLVIQETLSLFNISTQSGLAIGWIIWSSQTILTVTTGVLSFFYLPMYNSKNKTNCV